MIRRWSEALKVLWSGPLDPTAATFHIIFCRKLAGIPGPLFSLFWPKQNMEAASCLAGFFVGRDGVASICTITGAHCAGVVNALVIDEVLLHRSAAMVADEVLMTRAVYGHGCMAHVTC